MTRTAAGRRGAADRLAAPSLGQVWLLAPVALALFAAGAMPLESVDLWWSLVLGSSASLGVDPIVFTPLVGADTNVQWLAQRLLAGAYHLGGPGLVLGLRTGLVGLTVGLLELLALRIGARPIGAATAALLALPLLLAGAAVRPQMFVPPLFVLVLLGCVAATRRDGLLLVTLPSLLWANLHGSFLLAPVVPALLALTASAADRRDRLALAGAAGLATIINPWGPEIYSAAFGTSRANASGGVQALGLEWRPLDPLSATGALYLLIVGVAILGLLARRSGRLGWLALLAPLALLPIIGARHTLWFTLAATPVAALRLGALGSGGLGRPAINRAVCALLAAIGLLGLARPLAEGPRRVDPTTPIALADELARLRPARVFSYSDWGGYLAWRLEPTGRVFVDNRFEQHPDWVWREYRSVSLAETGWQQTLDAQGIDALALEPVRQAPLAAALAESDEWRQVFADARSTLYVRR